MNWFMCVCVSITPRLSPKRELDTDSVLKKSRMGLWPSEPLEKVPLGDEKR